MRILGWLIVAGVASDWYLPTPEEERLAQRWYASSDPAVGVGAKHHTVPAFYLRRFASGDGQLLVRDRPTGRLRPPIAVSDLAITNFYTVVSKDGSFDGRMEQLLSRVETGAAEILKMLISPYRHPGSLTPVEKVVLCQFVAFQLVRGPRKRREIELQADYAFKLEAGHTMTDKDLREITAVPHPNDHIRMMGPTSYAIFRCLLPRPVMVARIDAPMFVTCDEPVLVDVENHVRHGPDCNITQAELRRRRKRAAAAGSTYQRIVHVWDTRPTGVQIADAMIMPLAPSVLLVLGRPGQPSGQANFTGEEARQVADEVNKGLLNQAYEWVAARPDHPSFRGWEFPPPGPLIGVCDGGSVMSQQLQSAPSHPWQRIRRNWPGMPGNVIG